MFFFFQSVWGLPEQTCTLETHANIFLRHVIYLTRSLVRQTRGGSSVRMAAAPSRRGVLQDKREVCKQWLSSAFNHSDFRLWQWLVISALDRGENCVVNGASGSGKALPYQFLSYARSAAEHGAAAGFGTRSGTTLAVSPSSSLARAQHMMFLARTHVRAVVLDTLEPGSTAWLAAAAGKYDLLLATPAGALRWLPQLQVLAQRGLLDLVAVDEGERACTAAVVWRLWVGYKGDSPMS